MGTRKVRTNNCISCEVIFMQEDGKDIHHAGGMCRACYYKSRYYKFSTVRKNPNLGYCYNCKELWGTISSKGKEVKNHSSQLCAPCYHREYKYTTKICKICNEEILNKTARNVCKRCFVPIKDNIKKEKDKKQLINDKVDKIQFEKLRLLLVRYKFGNNDDIDNYILLDLYMSLICKEVHISKYENIDATAQIIYMLKDLKELYENYKKTKMMI